MKDKVKDVREDLLALRDKMFDELTTLESVPFVPAKKNASVKVVILDSRLTVRTPHNNIDSSLIKYILQRKWQQKHSFGK